MSMSEVKILYLDRLGNDFSKAEKAIEQMLKEGWSLVSVTTDAANTFKLIAAFRR